MGFFAPLLAQSSLLKHAAFFVEFFHEGVRFGVFLYIKIECLLEFFGVSVFRLNFRSAFPCHLLILGGQLGIYFISLSRGSIIVTGHLVSRWLYTTALSSYKNF